MLVFSVLLLVSSTLAAPAVLTTTVGSYVQQPYDEHVVLEQQQQLAANPQEPQNYQPAVGVPVDNPTVQQPYAKNVFVNHQAKSYQQVVHPVHQQQPFIHHGVQHQPQALVYQGRHSTVDSKVYNVHPEYQAGVVPGSHVVHKVAVQPHHHVAGHGDVVVKSHVDEKLVQVQARHHAPGHEGVADYDSVVKSHEGVVSGDNVSKARILDQETEINPDGSFSNVWHSDNGISVQEQGSVKHVGKTDVAVQQGEISYVDDQGVEYHLKYIADETGFHVEGAHIPTPPPIPAAIAKGLEFIAAHPYVETTTVPDEYYQQPGQSVVVEDH